MLSVVPRKTGNGSRPVYPLTRLRDEFDAVLNRFYAGLPAFFEKPFFPETNWAFNVEETDKEFVVFAEAPGFEATDFNISATGNMLTLLAEHEEKAGKKPKEEFSFTERSFARYFTLPPGVNTDKMEAFYKNGILEVHILKCEEAKPKKIFVKS